MVEGFVYVSAAEPGPMADARVGARVRTPALRPPWIVVHHELAKMTVGRWPGRLFRVASAPPESDAERAGLAQAAAGLKATAGYTRVFAVDVLAELSPGELFGPHGEAVVEVLEWARGLTESQARQLANARHPGADQAFGRAWERWLAKQPNGAAYLPGDFRYVLSVPGAGPIGSPVGSGLTLVRWVVGDTARRRVGERAFSGDGSLENPWAMAAVALVDAALALGAPGLVDLTDNLLLATAWNTVHS